MLVSVSKSTWCLGATLCDHLKEWAATEHLPSRDCVREAASEQGGPEPHSQVRAQSRAGRNLSHTGSPVIRGLAQPWLHTQVAPAHPGWAIPTAPSLSSQLLRRQSLASLGLSLKMAETPVLGSRWPSPSVHHDRSPLRGGNRAMNRDCLCGSCGTYDTASTCLSSDRTASAIIPTALSTARANEEAACNLQHQHWQGTSLFSRSENGDVQMV